MTDESKKISIGIPKETFPDERRVAIVPDTIPQFEKQNLKVTLEAGAGLPAGFTDEAYRNKGAAIVESRSDLFESNDIILQVRAAGANPDKAKSEIKLYRSGQAIVGHFEPLSEYETIDKLASKGATTYAIELLPRITKAQSMDALSSMATIAGYKAVLLAAEACPKIFPLLMTAAGTVSAAHAFIVGAGVAGLQAIATARRLGAVVKAYDVRPAVKEQVQSLGASFVELDLSTEDAEDKGGYAKEAGEEFYKKQREMMTGVVAKSDVVITTAAIPGKKAPVLITEDMVKAMPPGSIIVDLAAERGGNCELTKAGETVEAHNVKILGPINLPSTIPYHASQMYARNLLSFIRHLVGNGGLEPNREDEIIRDTMLTSKGEVVNERVKELLSSAGN